MTPELQTKVLAVTNGSKMGAILRCATDAPKAPGPRFIGKASITSDGFVMCDFIDEDGNGHHGAFVGGWSEVEGNVNALSAHLDLNAAEREQLQDVVAGWVGGDWRSIKTMFGKVSL